MLIQQLVNGVVLSAIYALVALAFSLVMGIFGVLNVAISALFMIGGYVGLIAVIHGLPVWAALLGAALAGAALGVLVERIGYAPFRRAPVIIPLLSTLGCSIVLQNIATNVWGSDPLQITNPPLAGSVSFAGVRIGDVQVLMIGVALVFVTALAVVVRRTKLGRALRAVAENREVADLLGVPVTMISIAAFAISGLLAGTAGFLVALNYGQITPYIGVDIGLKGIAVMVVGGVDNIWGVLVAAPILGIAEVLTIAYGASSYRDAVAFGVLILILLVRPQGLL
ncbi:MAG: branched-chain amino acid ABC transporter permease, partial [Candidatus Dormibacteria bacterium]